MEFLEERLVSITAIRELNGKLWPVRADSEPRCQ